MEMNYNEELIANALLMRHELLRKLMDPRRDYNAECGYPELIGIQDYQDMYDRFGIGTRVVEVYPKECWKSLPRIYETENVEEETAFEAAFKEIGFQLDRNSWLSSTETTGNLLFDYMKRIDILSGVGHYGVVIFGINDRKPLYEPAGFRQGTQLNFIRVVPEVYAQIGEVDSDRNSPRYGLPLYYNITMQKWDERLTEQFKVHWTRCLHVADNLTSSEILGVPRMHPVFDRLLDLRKMYGGSAEMYWRGAFPGLSIETHPQLGGEVVLDAEEMNKQIDRYQNSLQRHLALLGMTAKSLAPQVVDPTPQIERQIESICITLGVPKRVFMGSEQGELASTQDKDSWAERIQERQVNHLTPRLVGPFVNRLISLGVLPEPEQFFVDWSKVQEVNPQDQANVAKTRTEALVAYVNSPLPDIIVPRTFLTLVLGMSQEEADEALTHALLDGENIDRDAMEGLDGEEDFTEEDEDIDIDIDENQDIDDE